MPDPKDNPWKRAQPAELRAPRGATEEENPWKKPVAVPPPRRTRKSSSQVIDVSMMDDGLDDFDPVVPRSPDPLIAKNEQRRRSSYNKIEPVRPREITAALEAAAHHKWSPSDEPQRPYYYEEPGGWRGWVLKHQSKLLLVALVLFGILVVSSAAASRSNAAAASGEEYEVVGATDAPHTSTPTSQPTSPKPTRLPTSDAPSTSRPTDSPTSLSPTSAPISPTSAAPTTALPTKNPTLLPTTNSPTRNPSLFPTSNVPTESPSKFPTSSFPTPFPTGKPMTSFPTSKPSVSPTFRPTSFFPHVVLLMADDLGWGDVEYQNPHSARVKTPHLNAWSKDSSTVRFDNFHSPATICSPSRASVLTGRNNFRVCVNAGNGGDYVHKKPVPHAIRKDAKSVAEAAKTASNGAYRTFFGGKWHIGDLTNVGKGTTSPKDFAFDRWVATQGKIWPLDMECFANPKNCWAASGKDNCGQKRQWCVTHDRTNLCMPKTSRACPSGPHHPLDDFSAEFYSKPNTLYVEKDKGELSQSSAEFLFHRWKRFLDSNEGRPTLSLIWFNEPHIPFVAKESIRQRCMDGEICYRDRVWDWDGATSHYLGTIYQLDMVIGDFISELKSRGMYDNTFLSFTSDNGPEIRRVGGRGFASVLRGQKREVFEGGHRVTGLISYPKLVKKNLIWTRPASAIDYLPTLLEIWDYTNEWTDVFEGESLVPILSGNFKKYQRTQPIIICGGGFITTDRCDQLAWIQNDLKLVILNGANAGVSLFNLTHDIGETVDLNTPLFLKLKGSSEPSGLGHVQARMEQEARSYRANMLWQSDTECP